MRVQKLDDLLKYSKIVQVLNMLSPNISVYSIPNNLDIDKMEQMQEHINKENNKILNNRIIQAELFVHKNKLIREKNQTTLHNQEHDRLFNDEIMLLDLRYLKMLNEISSKEFSILANNNLYLNNNFIIELHNNLYNGIRST